MARSTCPGHVDLETIDRIIERNALSRLGLSKGMFAGDCPFCGHPKAFVLWRDSGNYRCYFCGCDGRFVRAPERSLMKEREAKEASGG